MGLTPEFNDAFIEQTHAFVTARYDYVLGDIAPAALFSALHGRSPNNRSPEQELVLHSFTERYEKYENLARKRFVSVNGFFLRWLDLSEMDLVTNSKVRTSHDSRFHYTSLTTKIYDGDIKVEMISHEGNEQLPLTPTAEDYITIAEAIVKLGVVRNKLSEEL